MKSFEWVSPSSEAQAIAELKADKRGAVAKAGGIDLVDRMKLGITQPARVVNLLGLPALRFLRADGKALRIGPTTTLAQVAADPLLAPPRYLCIGEAALSAANPQIRNLATVGGNLLQRPRCWYYRNPEFECFKRGGSTCYAQKGENRHHAILGGGPSYIVHPSTMATALVALDARARIVGGADIDKNPRGREVPLDGFFTLPREDYERENRLEPDELIAELIVPSPGDGGRSAYRAIKERQVYDWPLAEVAVSLVLRGDTVESARVVLGAAAPIPWRSKEAEGEIVGKRLSQATAAAAGRASMSAAKPLAHNGYKLPLFTALVERTLLAAAGKA
jgi:xanthine dehydrogenase YagS FAD-binding subunit